MSDALRTGAVLFVSDLHRMTSFYKAVLGLRETHRDSDHVVLKNEGYELVVHRASVQSASTAPPSAATRRETAAFKPVFYVAGPSDVRIAIANSGGVMEPEERAWSFDGFTVCDAVDPEGNVIQLRYA